jgi:catechol 2,3-dioxygenase-like lactoylglutathione lyase family enzyme
VQLNHTIVWCRDMQKSASFLVEILGLPAPVPFGPMLVVQLNNNVSLDFYSNDGEIASQHYAFLISEGEFDQILGRIRDRGLSYWADPGKSKGLAGEIYKHNGGRGVYFEDPDGHLLEVMTRPYANIQPGARSG